MSIYPLRRAIVEIQLLAVRDIFMAKEKQFEVRDKRAKDRFYLDDLYLNGYARLCGIYATGVYVSLCRHANLEQKCWPSIKKIAEELAVSEKQVGRAIKKLEEYNIISKERVGKKATNRYWLLNKSEWTTSPISEGTHSPITTDSQSYHQGTDSPFHSKDTNKKDTNSKESNGESVAGLNELIELFNLVNPSYKRLFANTIQRSALERLVKEHGEDKVRRMIEFLPKSNAIKYAPTITTPLKLEEKLGDLIAFVNKKRQESPKVVL